MAEIRGTLSPLRQRTSERWSPTHGHTREFEWRGLSENQIRTYAYQYARAGCEYEYVSQHGVYTLVAVDTSGEVTIDTWEVQVNQVFVSSLLNPFNIENISTGNREIIARAVKDGSSLAEAQGVLEDETGDIYGDVTDAIAIRLYKRLIAGDDTFLAYRYVLRHTTNVSNRYTINVADQYVGYIYSTAELLSETQDGDSWIYPLPGRLAYKLNNLAYPSVDQIDAFSFWGWHKSASSESTAANNRVNIVTEYVLGAWKTDEYLLR